MMKKRTSRKINNQVGKYPLPNVEVIYISIKLKSMCILFQPISIPDGEKPTPDALLPIQVENLKLGNSIFKESNKNKSKKSNISQNNSHLESR